MVVLWKYKLITYISIHDQKSVKIVLGMRWIIKFLKKIEDWEWFRASSLEFVNSVIEWNAV